MKRCSSCHSMSNLTFNWTLFSFAMFVHNGRKDQVDDLFVLVAEEYLKELHQSPSKTIWLSTSGLGIGWVHFRLDYSPKYYN
jgi:hypothetical protein